MTPTRALLVDMDGTLVDTATANYEAYAAALAAVGVAVDRGDFEAEAAGRNWRQFLPPILAKAGSAADPEAIARQKAAIFPSKAPLTLVNTAVVSLLRSARANLHTALVTTASQANVDTVLGHHSLLDLFDTIVTGSDVSRHKPDPEAYFLAAERLGLAPAECLVLEDSEVGVKSARAFGAPCLVVRFP